MQSSGYGQLASPVSPEGQWDPPAHAKSYDQGDVTYSIGKMSMGPQQMKEAASLGAGSRRGSNDAGAAASAHQHKAKGEVGWEPVSPGILDQSPEVVASRRPNEYYWPEAPVPAPAQHSSASGAQSSSASGSSTHLAPPPMDRRNSKAAELSFPIHGLDGDLAKLSNAEFKQLLKNALRASDLETARRLLTAPLPESVGTVQMFLKRHRHGFFSTMYPTYEVFLEEPDRPFFLMSAKKRTKNKTSNYTISLLPIDMLSKSNSEAANTAEDPNYLGKLRSNFTGSEYVGYDAGINPKTLIEAASGHMAGPLHLSQRRPSESKMQNLRQELCTILYDSNIMSRCPRKFRAVVPGMLKEDPTKRIICRPLVPSDTLLYQYKKLMESDAAEKPRLHEEELVHQEILVLGNKEPAWEPAINAFCLNFKGRAAIASVKNFQLINTREVRLIKKTDSKVHLQFGKMAKDVFTMDAAYPLSILQAFEISLAGLDTKIVCD